MLILNPQDQILLVRHNYGQRRYSFPGGAVEPGEAVLDAAIREVQEELGIQILPERLVGVYRTTGLNKPDRDVYVFLALLQEPFQFQTDPLEIAEVLWTRPLTLPSPLTNEVQAAVTDHLAGIYGAVRTVQRQN